MIPPSSTSASTSTNYDHPRKSLDHLGSLIKRKFQSNDEAKRPDLCICSQGYHFMPRGPTCQRVALEQTVDVNGEQFHALRQDELAS